MTLHDYATGDMIRTLTEDEAAAYAEMIAGDTTGAGAVDGRTFGHEGTVYAV